MLKNPPSTIGNKGGKYPTNSSNFIDRLKVLIINNKMIASLIVITIITFFLMISINRQRWMVWQEDHYVEVKLDTDKYPLRKLKLYKEERIKDFKRVNTDCKTVFFNERGEVSIWHGKNSTKKLEYFTSFGLHPETGKTLRPITKYMIKKYICENYPYNETIIK